ncbi:hypothetical protein BDN72DRAFT_897612 [Pluteus cervinus]|uniref:Uncharacterized protein n=1 Tax=Pluteus cervinus TaxID=181527 RepID=A0ACD3AU11_9AGAR|nr:hypothetical protein BDN72DRAFT_897612 [Pluteus cervinus]
MATAERDLYSSGAVGAIKASIKHPLIQILREDKDCKNDRDIQRKLESLEAKTDIQLVGKRRPCLIISSHGKEIFLMGTMEGRYPSQIKKLIRHFLVSINPTPSTDGYSLSLRPSPSKSPSYVLGYPHRSGSWEEVEGLWSERVFDADTQRTEHITYQVDLDDLAGFMHAHDTKWESFTQMQPSRKKRMALDFLEDAEARTIRTGRTSTFTRARTPISSKRN